MSNILHIFNRIIHVFYNKQWIQKNSLFIWLFMRRGPIVPFYSVFLWINQWTIQFIAVILGNLVGLCVCSLSSGINLIWKGVETFSVIITMCSITVFLFNKIFTQLNIFRIIEIRVMKRKFFWKCDISLKYGKGRNTSGAKFLDGCTKQRTL